MTGISTKVGPPNQVGGESPFVDSWRCWETAKQRRELGCLGGGNNLCKNWKPDKSWWVLRQATVPSICTDMMVSGRRQWQSHVFWDLKLTQWGALLQENTHSQVKIVHISLEWEKKSHKNNWIFGDSGPFLPESEMLIYVPHLLYLFICRWTFRLVPCPGYCK